jgi:hypothetical protein
MTRIGSQRHKENKEDTSMFINIKDTKIFQKSMGHLKNLGARILI